MSEDEKKDTAAIERDLEDRRDRTRARNEKIERVAREALEVVIRAGFDSEETIGCVRMIYASIVAQTYERTPFLRRDEDAKRWGAQLRDTIDAMILGVRKVAGGH